MKRRNDILKVVAMTTMLIDHIGVMIFPELLILRTIGRIAFPIFAYQIAKGFKYTSNRKKYITRLLLFAVISYLPYVYLNNNITITPLYFNVLFFFSYAIGVLYLVELFEKFKTHNISLSYILIKIGILLSIIVSIIIPPLLENIFYGDFMFSYSAYGLIMIIIFYKYEDKIIPTTLFYIVLSFIYTYYRGVVVNSYYGEIAFLKSSIDFKNIWILITTYNDGLKTLSGFFMQCRSLLALPFIFIIPRINIDFKLNKYIAYYFYPLHITLLIIISLLIK